MNTLILTWYNNNKSCLFCAYPIKDHWNYCVNCGVKILK
jgi:hypothetical protein